MKIEQFEDGYAVCGDATSQSIIDACWKLTGEVPLIMADPPYGGILDAEWDQTELSAVEFAEWMVEWTYEWSRHLSFGGAFYVWGGVGKPGFRPFLRYILSVEDRFDVMGLKLANLITWKKKRAYGVKHNYLFTREELAYFIRHNDIRQPRCFNIPLLEEKRGYAGYNAKYPAKSEFYRRANVWTDITEVMQGKVHDAQKAQRVIEVPIEVHTNPGEWVVDPFAGSGTTALAARKLGRKFLVVEKDEKTFDEMVARIHAMRVNGGNEVVVSSHDQDVSG